MYDFPHKKSSQEALPFFGFLNLNILSLKTLPLNVTFYVKSM
ncbi:hypothetical protein TZ05_0472c [Listeria monocytogenes]|nr:hypothetical protein TZ05_0472c [Listeria monocytogenes]KSZ37777.1 hypothetical protein AN945_2726 [Listeria monocytogenes]